MRKGDLSKLSTPELVARFEKLVLDQEIELLSLESKRYNRLFDRIVDITSELKSRDGDERRHLLTFLDHESPHLRYVAAIKCDDLDPSRTRKVLQEIADSGITPYALNAGMSLWMKGRKESGEI